MLWALDCGLFTIHVEDVIVDRVIEASPPVGVPLYFRSFPTANGNTVSVLHAPSCHLLETHSFQSLKECLCPMVFWSTSSSTLTGSSALASDSISEPFQVSVRRHCRVRVVYDKCISDEMRCMKGKTLSTCEISFWTAYHTFIGATGQFLCGGRQSPSRHVNPL